MNLQQKMEKIHVAIQTRSRETPPVILLPPLLPHEVLRLEVDEKEAEKKQLQRIEELMQKIPPLFRGKSVDDFNIDYPEQMTVKSIAMRYVETGRDRLLEGTNLLFCGISGTGKTLLALIMYQALIKLGFTAHYEPSLQFLRALQEKNLQSAREFANQLDFYKNIQFLIVDEATQGRVKGNELLAWEKETLFSLMDMRYQHRLCTLFISNNHRANLTQALGERVAGRLTEHGITLAFNWNSYRQ